MTERPKIDQIYRDYPLEEIIHFSPAEPIAAPPTQPLAAGPSTPILTPILRKKQR